MTLVVVNGGKVAAAQQLKAWLNGLILRLYQNNRTPAITNVAGDYLEATFTGYASQAIVSFGNAFLNTSSIAELDASPMTFTQTGTLVTNTIFGYYVTDVAGNLIYAELNPNGSFNMNQTGLQYTVQPIMTLANIGGT